MTAAPGPVPDVSLLGLGLGPMAAAPLAQVYVGNVTFGMSEEEIRFVFERCGAVRHVQLVKDAESHKAYSFVEYESPQAAEQAIATLDGFGPEPSLQGNRFKLTHKIFVLVGILAFVHFLLSSSFFLSFPPEMRWVQKGQCCSPQQRDRSGSNWRGGN